MVGLVMNGQWTWCSNALRVTACFIGVTAGKSEQEKYVLKLKEFHGKLKIRRRE